MGSSGSTSTTTVDEAYNAGLLEIFQEQEGWAGELYNMFKYGVTYDPTAQVTGYYDANGNFIEGTDTSGYPGDNGDEEVTGFWHDGNWINESDLDEYTKPLYADQMETMTNAELWALQNPDDAAAHAQNNYVTTTMGDVYGYDTTEHTSEMDYLQQIVDANASLLGLETDVSESELELAGATAEASTSLIPYQTEASKQAALLSSGQSEASLSLLPQVTALKSDYLTDVSEGTDIGEAMDQAQASVQHGYKLANEASRMDISSYGLDPSSGKYTSSNRDIAMSEAADIAGARTAAKEEAEDTDFDRQTTALGLTY